MRKDAFAVIDCFRKLIFGESSKGFVANAKRFKTEFGDNGYRIHKDRNVSFILFNSFI